MSSIKHVQYVVNTEDWKNGSTNWYEANMVVQHNIQYFPIILIITLLGKCSSYYTVQKHCMYKDRLHCIHTKKEDLALCLQDGKRIKHENGDTNKVRQNKMYASSQTLM